MGLCTATPALSRSIARSVAAKTSRTPATVLDGRRRVLVESRLGGCRNCRPSRSPGSARWTLHRRSGTGCSLGEIPRCSSRYQHPASDYRTYTTMPGPGRSPHSRLGRPSWSRRGRIAPSARDTGCRSTSRSSTCAVDRRAGIHCRARTGSPTGTAQAALRSRPL
ncbi:hypothetical protein REQ_34541 [Prescottella equi 103S]|uniref:Uncharacterized protein n=1 Tax=Rhodococcus hoagii (strain 103S) TaxID=685727 RepID=A0A3S5YA79_RHOH1|nr:hypothetical protein REQ_34541 [Prescottella equi 103S]